MELEQIRILIQEVVPAIETENTSQIPSILEIGSFHELDSGRAWLSIQSYSDTRTRCREYWNSSTELNQNYSLNSFVNMIVRTAGELALSESPDADEAAVSIFSELRDRPITEYEIVREVTGIRFSRELHVLGPVTLYNHSNRSSVKCQKNGGSAIEGKILELLAKWPYSAGVRVQAREPRRAEERAEHIFHEFEEIGAYLLGRDSSRYIGIATRSHKWDKDYVCLAGQQSTYGYAVEDFSSEVDLDKRDDFIESKVSAFFFDLIGEKTSSGLKDALVRAAIWVGRANRDSNASKALVQYVFAMESLLTYQARQEVLGPSITHQIRESAAFLLTDGYEDRKKLIKTIGDIYSRRSAVAHGGTTRVEDQILNSAYVIANHLIARITGLVLDEDLATKDDLKTYIEKIKYS